MRAANFEGYDPYDFFNLKKLPVRLFNQRHGPRFTFLNKMSPINMRPLLGIARQQNAVANALFALGYMYSDFDSHQNTIENLIDRLLAYRSDEFSEFSLGFAYHVAMREHIAYSGAASLTTSLFGMNAFIEYYRRTSDEQIFNTILSFERLLESKTPRFESPEKLWYSYNFTRVNEVYHITAQIGRFYAMLFKLTEDRKYIGRVRKISNYLLSKQRADGSWAYSRKIPAVDGYHFALMLQTIWDTLCVVEEEQYHKMFRRGLDNYKSNLFKEACPLHLHPLHTENEFKKHLIETDTRDCASALLLFSQVGDMTSASEVLQWTVENLYNHSEAYFYFYVNRFWVNKIKFISLQAWMFYAMSRYLGDAPD
jgi:hypothetical protein